MFFSEINNNFPLIMATIALFIILLCILTYLIVQGIYEFVSIVIEISKEIKDNRVERKKRKKIKETTKEYIIDLCEVEVLPIRHRHNINSARVVDCVVEDYRVER